MIRELLAILLIAPIPFVVWLLASSAVFADQHSPIPKLILNETRPDPCYLDDVICEYEKPKIIKTFWATVYGYSSEVSQTDSSPEITASGKHVRNGIVANNCLSFGTKIKIQGLTYLVDDRMNARYNCDSFDIWFSSKEEALHWGKKKLWVTVLQK